MWTRKLAHVEAHEDEVTELEESGTESVPTRVRHVLDQSTRDEGGEQA